MRTIKQIKARKRNFTIMYLTGVLTMLNYIDKQMRNYVLKGALNSTRISIEYLLILIKETNYEHSFYGPQKDVNYECK
mgnify:CR=1 FL=1